MKTKANEKQTNAFQKWKVVLVLCLLVAAAYPSMAANWTGSLTAGTYTLTTVGSSTQFKVTCSNTSSPYHNQTYDGIGNITVAVGTNSTVTINFNNTRNIIFAGAITLNQGRLYLKRGNVAFTGTAYNLIRTRNYKGPCIIVNNSSSSVWYCRLYIQGYNENKPFIVNGACGDVTVTPDGTSYTANHSLNTIAEAPLVLVHGGLVETRYAEFKGNWLTSGQGGSAFYITTQGDAYGIYGTANSRCQVTLKHTSIHDCYCYGEGSGSAFLVNCGRLDPSNSTEIASSLVLDSTSSVFNCFSDKLSGTSAGSIYLNIV